VLAVFGSGALAIVVLERRLGGLSYLFWACASSAFLTLIVAAQQGSVMERLGNLRLLQFFGKYSYGMYVFQLPLIFIVARIITAQGVAELFGNAIVGQIVYCFLMFAVTTGAALLSWHWFEKRWLAFKQYFV
jgi:peptidoglycan/LPS O-acetylase OafA/YrhL